MVVRKLAVRFFSVDTLVRPGSLFLLLGALSFAFPGLAGQTGRLVHMPDNSDWWSSPLNSNFEESMEPQKRELAKTNFQVLGITLGENMLSSAARKLGRVTIVERGDASTGRSQACYTSAGAEDKVHLIFEEGEVEYTFFLFAGGPTWEGANYCLASKAISRSVATASGLRLGQSPAEVIAILGKPTNQRKNVLVYSFSVRKKASPQDLKEARERNPDMSEKEIQEHYGYYDLGTGVVAKFADSKLIYLAVSKVEST